MGLRTIDVNDLEEAQIGESLITIYSLVVLNKTLKINKIWLLFNHNFII